MPEDCRATVGQIEACFNASVELFDQMMTAMPTCKQLEVSDFE